MIRFTVRSILQQMRFVTVLMLSALGLASGPVAILFIGNSFTFGDGSPVKTWRPDSVKDLNDEKITITRAPQVITSRR